MFKTYTENYLESIGFEKVMERFFKIKGLEPSYDDTDARLYMIVSYKTAKALILDELRAENFSLEDGLEMAMEGMFNFPHTPILIVGIPPEPEQKVLQFRLRA